ncbi:alpha/beta hydrolase [Paraclostridium sp. AKS46]|nr:alpha/beta hydrolase [Paraclostridium sp. AKS46]
MINKDVFIYFPHAGGSKNYFKDIFSNEYHCIGIEYPGHGSRFIEGCCNNIDSLVESVWESIYPEILEYYGRKIVIFGHSMGAFVAYKVIQKLEFIGIKPSAFIISSKSSPQYDVQHEINHLIQDDEVKQFLESYGETPKEILEIPEMFDIVKQLIISDTRVLQSFVESFNICYYNKIITPIYLIRGDNDTVSYESMKDWENISHNYKRTTIVEGDHFYFNKSSDKLSEYIESIFKESTLSIFSEMSKRYAYGY